MRLSVVVCLAIAAGAQDCPAGKQSSIGGNCTFCEPGRFADGIVFFECEPAAAGSYVADAGATKQTPCPPGTYSPGTGAAACTLCDAGRYVSEEGSTSCDLSSAGEFVALRGATTSRICPAGRFSGTADSTCGRCPPGTVSLAGWGTCDFVAAGAITNEAQYCAITLASKLFVRRDVNIQEVQITLTTNLERLAGGYPVVVESNSDSTGDDSSALLFRVELSYGAVGGESVSNFSAIVLEDFQQQVRELIETTFQEKLDVDASLNAVEETTVVIEFPDSWDDLAGQTRDCPPGKFSRSGATVCEDCEVGLWSSAGSDTCGECASGYFYVGGWCETCADGMVCDENGLTAATVRLENMRWRSSAYSTDIETCPLKKSCRSNRASPCVDDLSTTDSSDRSCFHYDDFPEDCGNWDDEDFTASEQCCACRVSEGTLAPTPGIYIDAGEALCEEGHEGPLCAVCKRHYYRLGLECVKCRRSTLVFTIIGLIVGIIIFGAFFILAMNYSNVVGKVVEEAHKSGKGEADESVGETFGRQGSVRYARGNSTSSFGLGLEAVGSAVEGEASEGVERTIDEQNLSWWPKARRRLQKAAATDALRRNVTTFFKQLSGTYSILVSIPWIFDIKFPNLYEKVLERLALVNVDMSFSLECVVSRKVTFQDRLLANTIGPIVAILVVLALGVLYLRFKRHKDEERDERKRTTTLVIAQLILLIMFLSYTSTSTIIFRAFRPCHNIGEKYHGSNSYMYDDYSTSCNSKRYVFIVAYAAVMALVYPIGIPLVSFVVMWRNREKLDPKLDSRFLLRGDAFEKVGESDAAFRRARVEQKTELRSIAIQPKADELFSFAQLYHFMYDNYEPQYWWFECFDYLRRLALTGLMVVIAPGTALQGFIGVLIALGGLMSYTILNPFVEDASDRLAMGAQLATFFIFLSALMVQVDAVYHRSGFAVLLVVVTFVPPFISVCSAFHAFHSAMKQMEPNSPKAPGSEGSDSAKSPRSSEASVKGPDRVEDDEEQQKPAP